MPFKKLQTKSSFACLLLVLLTLLVYSFSLGNGFVWDDYLNIVDNIAVKSWSNFPQLFSHRYLTYPEDLVHLQDRNVGFGELSYRPVTTATYFLDYSIWKLNPFGFHLTSLVLHVINVLLVFWLAGSIFPRRIEAFGTAVIFAVHPIQSEAVMVASFREDLLALLFYLLAFISYIRHRQTQRTGWPIVSLVCYFLALFSKEMAITLPVMLFFYDQYFTDSGTIPLKKRIGKNYLGYLIVALFYLWIWSGPMAPGYKNHVTYPAGSFVVNLLTMNKVVAVYIGWLLSGIGLHPTMADPGIFAYHLWEKNVIFSLLLLLSCLYGIGHWRPTHKTVSFGLLWFFVSLGPVLNIFPLFNIMAARYVYLPSVGFILAVVGWGASMLDNRMKISKPLLGFMLGGICLFLALQTITQGYRFFKNELGYRLSMQAYYPDNAMVYRNIAGAYERLGHYDQVIVYCQKAKKLDPADMDVYCDLAGGYEKLGRPDLAIRELIEAVAINPHHSYAYNKLCSLYGTTGQLKDAAQCFDSLLMQNPKDLLAYFNQGLTYQLMGDVERARAVWRKALDIDPSYQPVLKALGRE